MKAEEIEQKLNEWRKQRNLSDPKSQGLKVVEEVGELAAAINKEDPEKLVDSIGDTLVTVILLAQMKHLDAFRCLESAWNVIKDRKGKTVDGSFVKEADLKVGKE